MRTRATELARRSDALYQGNISRRELCDRIAYLEEALREKQQVEEGAGGSGVPDMRGGIPDMAQRWEAEGR